MDTLKLDNQKLNYHISRLYQWHKGQDIYPIYIEVGLSGDCNCRCIFCAFDFLKYKPYILNIKRIKKFIREAARKKVKAILYSGEGEPLLHSRIAEIVSFTKRKGIDVALSTNGVMFDGEKAREILRHLTWMRVSLNAGTKKGYAFIHGVKKETFDRVVENLKKAVQIKNKNKYHCTIGVQFLLMPQNYKEVLRLASILSGIGVDYLAIKPYSQHPSSENMFSFIFSRRELFNLEKKLMKHSKDNFRIIFRHYAMEKLRESKPYKHCLGLPFMTHITAEGDVYPCNNFVGNKEFLFGNICQKGFGCIWSGERRKRIMKKIYAKWNVKDCRNVCRLDEINRYLWELKNPGTHINFI